MPERSLLWSLLRFLRADSLEGLKWLLLAIVMALTMFVATIYVSHLRSYLTTSLNDKSDLVMDVVARDFEIGMFDGTMDTLRERIDKLAQSDSLGIVRLVARNDVGELIFSYPETAPTTTLVKANWITNLVGGRLIGLPTTSITSIRPLRAHNSNHLSDELKALSGNTSAYSPALSETEKSPTVELTIDITREMNAANKRVFSVVGVALICILLIMWLLHESLGKATRTLRNKFTSAMDALLQTNTPVDIPDNAVLLQEMYPIAQGWNRLAQDVRQHIAAANEYEAALEARIADRTLDLEQKNMELKAARDRAMQSDRAKTQLLSNVSHELQTPIMAIFSQLQWMSRQRQSQEIQSSIEMMNTQVRLLEQNVDDLLRFAQLHSGRLKTVSKPVAIHDMIESLIQSVFFRAAEKRLYIDFVPDPIIAEAHLVYSHELRKIVLNFLTNAIKYTEAGGIVVSTKKLPARQIDKETIRISVTDTGIGIDPADHHRIFDAFEQVDGSFTRIHDGVGLGLSIVKGCVDLFGGDCNVISEKGKGAEFFVVLDLDITRQIDSNIRLCALPLRKMQPRPTICVYDPRESFRTSLVARFAVAGLEVLPLADLSELNFGVDVLIVSDLLRDEAFEQAVTTALANRRVICALSLEVADSSDHAQIIGERAGVKVIPANSTTTELLVALARYLPHAQTHDMVAALAVQNVGHFPLTHVKLLLVDDARDNLRIQAQLLQEYGANVVSAQSGQDAIKHASEQLFDVIIMDLQMPVMDGRTAAENIRASTLNAKTPIVCLTANAMARELQHLPILFDRVLLKKTHEHDELISTLTELAQRQHMRNRQRPVS